MSEVKIGEYFVGDWSDGKETRHPTYIVAEIGINHNGDIVTALNMIEAAKYCGCDAVKFQKRTVDVVYSEAELSKSRESPFGTTNGDLKRRLEFGFNEYAEIDALCKVLAIDWFASPWDSGSVGFLTQFNPPAIKLASACITDKVLIDCVCQWGYPVIMSTGMSTIHEIDSAVYQLREHGIPLVLLHTISAYPVCDGDLNLRTIAKLRDRYNVPVGYSGHEVGIAPTLAAVAMGACVVERHFTLDRSMWGTDQSASVEPQGMKKIVDYIRSIEASMGVARREIFACERPAHEKLRRFK